MQFAQRPASVVRASVATTPASERQQTPPGRGSDNRGGGSSTGRKRAATDSEGTTIDTDDDEESSVAYRKLARQVRLMLLIRLWPSDDEIYKFCKSIYGQDINVDSDEFIRAKNKCIDARSKYKSLTLRNMEVSLEP
jgi:hypothetical protein